MVNGNNSFNETIVVSQHLVDFVVGSVRRSHADDSPFYHLRFDRVFPDDFYAEMLEAMPVVDDYGRCPAKLN